MVTISIIYQRIYGRIRGLPAIVPYVQSKAIENAMVHSHVQLFIVDKTSTNHSIGFGFDPMSVLQQELSILNRMGSFQRHAIVLFTCIYTAYRAYVTSERGTMLSIWRYLATVVDMLLLWCYIGVYSVYWVEFASSARFKQWIGCDLVCVKKYNKFEDKPRKAN